MDDRLTPALEALDDSVEALTELETTCCVPGRSPRMAEVASTIAAARSALKSLDEADAASRAADALLDAGGQVGRLQIGCCAPDRLPLYARILKDLTITQLTIDRVLGTGH